MSLHYEIIFGLLATEMLVFSFLLLPMPLQWKKSSLLFFMNSKIKGHLKTAVRVIFFLVVLLFIDSVNRTIKTSYQHDKYDRDVMRHSQSDVQLHANMFYAQRNMYLTGFTLFLSLVLNRFVFLLLQISTNEEKMEVVKKQAGNQSKEYIRLVEENKTLQTELKQALKEREEAQNKTKVADVALKQAKSQQEEYMRLSDRYNALEKRAEGRELERKKDL